MAANHNRMEKHPSWVDKVAESMQTRTTSYSAIVEAVMFDVRQMGDKDAKDKWYRLAGLE